MSSLYQIFSRSPAPVLRRELSQQAARKRTYVFRVAYALIIYSMGALAISDILAIRVAGNPLAALGEGGQIFRIVAWSQFCIVYGFLPAYCSGLITAEKERSTLALLLLTKLRPGSIVLEKMLSRLVPFAALLLIASPLLGIAYSFGGIGQTQIWLFTYLILLAAIQVAAIAIACSAICRTSVQAFIATYVVGAMFLHFGPVTIYGVCGGGYFPRGPGIAMSTIFGHVPLWHWRYGTPNPTSFLLGTWPILLTSLGWLIVAKLCLIRHAFARPMHPIATLFRGIDRCLGATCGQQTSERRLPDQHPISWRETQTGIFGSARHEIYAIVLVEIIVLLWIGFLKLTSRSEVDPAAIVNGMLLMFLCAALMVAAKSVALFSAERSQQTLDVLLSTPISNREILRQKFHGVRNLIALLLIPGLTFTVFFAFEASKGQEVQMKNFGFDISTYYGRGEFDPVRFYIVHLVTLVVYPQIVAWLGIIIGMRFKRITVALIVMLCILAAWVLVPVMILIPLFGFLEISPYHPVVTLFFLSPATVPLTTMFGDSVGNYPTAQATVSVIWHTGCWLVLRKLAHRQLERRLGRKTTKVGSSEKFVD